MKRTYFSKLDSFVIFYNNLDSVKYSPTFSLRPEIPQLDLPAVINFLRLKNTEILINMKKQIKKIKVRGLIFELEIPEDIGRDEILCDTRCPYGQWFCTKLPDPRKIKKPNRESCFMDFCSEDLGNAIPIKGSLDILVNKEKNL